MEEIIFRRCFFLFWKTNYPLKIWNFFFQGKIVKWRRNSIFLHEFLQIHFLRTQKIFLRTSEASPQMVFSSTQKWICKCECDILFSSIIGDIIDIFYFFTAFVFVKIPLFKVVLGYSWLFAYAVCKSKMLVSVKNGRNVKLIY